MNSDSVVPSVTGRGAATSSGPPESKANDDEKNGFFGNLTLQRTYATGHAVWLYLPSQGVKLRCNEMIHSRQFPINPDKTYFRGDRTRLVEI